MKYSLTNLIDKIGKHDTSMYEKYIPLFISEARKGLNWDEWNPDVFEQYFEKAANAVAYLGQGVMRPAQKETVKRRWTELAPHLKAIAESQDVPLWNEYKVIREIVKSCTGANMQVATNRMLAGLQPKLLSTEVDLIKINELFDYLQDYTDAAIPQYNKNCWEEAIQKRVKQLAIAAHKGCEEVPLDLHPHNYRHAYGTRRIRQGKQLAVVQREMGHRCIQSTMTYIDTSSMIEQSQTAAESETVKRIKPIWTGGDSLLAMYQSRFPT